MVFGEDTHAPIDRRSMYSYTQHTNSTHTHYLKFVIVIREADKKDLVLNVPVHHHRPRQHKAGISLYTTLTDNTEPRPGLWTPPSIVWRLLTPRFSRLGNDITCSTLAMWAGLPAEGPRDRKDGRCITLPLQPRSQHAILAAVDLHDDTDVNLGELMEI